jgi:hypothetical protein
MVCSLDVQKFHDIDFRVRLGSNFWQQEIFREVAVLGKEEFDAK